MPVLCLGTVAHHFFITSLTGEKKNLRKHYLYPRQPLKMSALQVLPSPKADFLEVPGWEAPSGGESQDTSQKKCVPITAASMFSGVCSSLLSSSKCSMIIFECDQAHTRFFWKYWQYCFWGSWSHFDQYLKKNTSTIKKQHEQLLNHREALIFKSYKCT